MYEYPIKTGVMMNQAGGKMLVAVVVVREEMLLMLFLLFHFCHLCLVSFLSLITVISTQLHY